MHYRKLVSNLDEMNNNYDITAKNKRRFGVVSSIDRLSSTQRMPPPVNVRIQDGGQRPPVLKGKSLVNHVTSPSKMATIQDSKEAACQSCDVTIQDGGHPRLKDGGFKMADDLSW